MAKFASEKLGEIEYDEGQVIDLADGVLGFPGLRLYVLIDHEGGPFMWLQSLEEPAIAFVVIDPWLFMPDFSPEIPDPDVAELELVEPYNFSILCVVTVPEEPSEATVNLMGPIVVNLNTRRAKQVVIPNPEYTTKHMLLEKAST